MITVREILARHMHDLWCRWAKYFLSSASKRMRIHWRLTAGVQFKDLDDEEQEHNLELADEILSLLRSLPLPDGVALTADQILIALSEINFSIVRKLLMVDAERALSLQKAKMEERHNARKIKRPDRRQGVSRIVFHPTRHITPITILEGLKFAMQLGGEAVQLIAEDKPEWWGCVEHQGTFCTVGEFPSTMLLMTTYGKVFRVEVRKVQRHTMKPDPIMSARQKAVRYKVGHIGRGRLQTSRESGLEYIEAGFEALLDTAEEVDE